MANDQELLIRINGSAKQFNDEIDRVNKKTKALQDGLTNVAKVSTAAFVGLATAIGGTVARFSSFEKGFTNVQTLLDKSSFSTKTLTEGINSLKEGVLEVGAKSGESFDNLNKGLFDLVSAGVAAEESVETLTVATNLAAAGATDTATAVKALTSVMTAFGDEAGSAQEISEKFFTAQKFGVTTVGELATNFNKVAGTAKNLGLSFDETLASLSALTADGAKPTAEAATQLRAAFNSIILAQGKLKGESAAVQDALSLQNIKQRGLLTSLELLKTATGGNVVELQRLLGSSESLSAVLSLTGAQADLAAKQVDAMGDAQARAATFADALRTKQETTEFALKRFKTSADAVAVTFGEVFAPTINAAAGALSAIAQKLASLDKDQIRFIAGVAKVAAVITGLTAALSILALGYLKLKAILIATNSVFKISTIATKAYNFALIAGRKAAQLFSAGLKFATASARGFAAATGIGLVLVALSLLITNFDKSKAVAIGSFKAIGAGLSKFAENANKILKSFGELLVGILTLDKAKINASLDGLKNDFASSFDGIGEAAAKAFNEGFDKSLAESKAAEIQGPEAAAGAPGKAGSTDPIKDQLDAEKTLKEEAAAQDDARVKSQLEAEQKRRDEAAAIRAEKELEQMEARQEAKELEDQLNTENEELLTEQELEKLNEDLLTKDEIRKQNAIVARKKEIARRNQFLKDEEKFGTTIAKQKQFLASEELKLADQTSGQLVKLTQSKNSTLKGIGKAAALTQIGIKTAEGAISANAALSGIPIVGPALGFAAAAALVAFGAEQASQVVSAQRGGVVPSGQGGARDRVPALLEPGEIVVPRAVAPDFQQAFGRPDVDEAEETGTSQEVIVGFTDDAFEIIEQKLLERGALGVGNI